MYIAKETTVLKVQAWILRPYTYLWHINKKYFSPRNTHCSCNKTLPWDIIIAFDGKTNILGEIQANN